MKNRSFNSGLVRLAVVFAAALASRANTYLVTNAQDSGAGSLRQAILNANARTGFDKIDFNIPGTGPFAINLKSALPTISDVVTIDGATQPGYTSSPLIELNGAAVPSGDGLYISQFTTTGCTIRALAIHRFPSNGIVLISGNNILEGNFIGCDATGMTDLPNALGGLAIYSPNNTIGGATPQKRNVISGNAGSGILFYGATARNNRVQGNYIGLTADGAAALPNLLSGVLVQESAADNSIGGLTAGSGNVISGNLLSGVEVFFAGRTIVQGNLIGLDHSGQITLPNRGAGVLITSSANSLIGGTTPAARNVISGNVYSGVNLNGDGTSGNVISGNLIGTDISGAIPLGNGGAGILLYGAGVFNTRIGGSTLAERNVIAANAYSGIEVDYSIGSSILGNYIGIAMNGSAAVGNGGDGILLSGARDSIIGGAASAQRNVVSGNALNGIEIVNSSTGNRVQGNFIGLAPDGVSPVGNAGGAGVLIQNSNSNSIGGGGAGNRIGYNPRRGVHIETGAANLISANSIFQNTGLGIDLGPSGRLANDDRDLDDGANTFQNHPTLTKASIQADRTVIAGKLNSKPSTSFKIELFANSGPFENPQAETYLGTIAVTTTSFGIADFTFEYLGVIAPGSFITATATDASNNTSEISDQIPATSPLRGTMGNIDLIARQAPLRFFAEAEKVYTLLHASDFHAIPVQWTCVQSFSGTGGEISFDISFAGDVGFYQIVEGSCP